MDDLQREQEIESVAKQIVDAQKTGNKWLAQNLFHLMAVLIGGRSDETVKRMEEERGLE